MKFFVSQMPNNAYYAFLLIGSKLMFSMQERQARLIMNGSLEVCSAINKVRRMQRNTFKKKWTTIKVDHESPS